jgi:hypothetical protein
MSIENMVLVCVVRLNVVRLNMVRSSTWCSPPGPQTRAQRGVKLRWLWYLETCADRVSRKEAKTQRGKGWGLVVARRVGSRIMGLVLAVRLNAARLCDYFGKCVQRIRRAVHFSR